MHLDSDGNVTLGQIRDCEKEVRDERFSKSHDVLDGESLRVPLPVASAGRNVKNVKNVSSEAGCSALVGNKEVILLNSRRGAGGGLSNQVERTGSM